MKFWSTLFVCLFGLLLAAVLVFWRGGVLTREARPRAIFHKSITQGVDVPMRADLTMTWRRHGITHTTQAHALLGTHGCFRMEYLTPAEAQGRIVYSDGKTQWQREPRRNLLATTTLLPEIAQNEQDTEDLIAQNYKIALVSEDENVEGRSAYLLELLPRQEGKSSQKRWIDCQTYKTLRLETHYPDGILARMVAYTRVTLPARVASSDFVPPASPTLQRVQTPLTSAILPMYTPLPHETGSVRSLGLRSEGALGFRLTQIASSAVEQAQTAHLLYSDGIETISVFVQNGAAPTPANAGGWHRISLGNQSVFENLDGHLDAILWTQGGHRYTAVSHLNPNALQQFVSNQFQSARAK